LVPPVLLYTQVNKGIEGVEGSMGSLLGYSLYGSGVRHDCTRITHYLRGRTDSERVGKSVIEEVFLDEEGRVFYPYGYMVFQERIDADFERLVPSWLVPITLNSPENHRRH